MTQSIDVSALRKDYSEKGLHRKDLLPDPIDQFRVWFDQAVQVQLPEPNAMVLSTVDAEHQPDSRTVLLKAFDRKGFVFFTNYESNKAHHIASNPNVSLCFPWFPMERQVIIRGTAARVSTAQSLKYFLSRPFGNRIGAWVSTQSKVISSRSLLEAKLKEMEQKFSDGEVPLPSFWGGYVVEPASVEFWQGGHNRLHDRFRYQKTDATGNTWQIDRLAP